MMEEPSEDLRIELLGEFGVTVGGRRVPPEAWPLRKARALVKLLALAPGHRLHREQVMDALWPDLEPRAAANQLRKAVHVARKALDPDPDAGGRCLRFTEQFLSLPPETWVDVHAFMGLAEEARRAGDVDRYRSAVELYRGELLPDDPYEDWAISRRDELRLEFLALCVELAGLLEARAELQEAIAVLRRVVALDPLHEEAHRGLMRLQALAGRRHDALQQYEHFRDVLRRELDADPEPETEELYGEIRAGSTLTPELRSELWERVGDLRRLSGDATGAAAAYASAVDADRPAPAVAARLHRKAAYALLMQHDTAKAEGHLGPAEQLLAGGDDPAELARVMGVRANWLWEAGQFQEAETAAEESRRLAELHGDAADLAAAYETLAIVHHVRGAWREGLHDEIERLGIAVDADPQLARIFDIHHCIGEYHLYGDGLFHDVEDYARRTLDLAIRRGARRAQAFAWCLLGESLLLRGHYDEAAGCLEQSGEIHGELGTRSGALPWQRLGELYVCRGEIDQAGAFVRRGMAIATVSPMARHVWGRLYATEALAALEEGDPPAAARAVRAAAAAGVRYGDCPTCDALLHPLAAEAYAALGDAEGSGRHAELSERTAGFWESSAWRAMARVTRGFHALASGEPKEARDLLVEAAELFDRGGQPFWAARSRLHAALAVPDGTDAVERRTLIEQARETFERLGARLAERRAAEALGQAGHP
jgi:DNA-binding SARP family transcriptional activator